MIKTSKTNDPEKAKKALSDLEATVGKKSPPIGLHGWICPVCGRGNSPSTSTCPCTIGNPLKQFPPYIPPYWPNNPFYYKDRPNIVWCGDVASLFNYVVV